MKVVIVQMDIDWCKPMQNVERAEKMVSAHPDADLFVLPEMWATGFVVEPEGFAEQEDDSVALSWMKSVASRQSCALSGSLAVRLSDGSYRNRHYYVTPTDVYYYDKHHLFTHGREHEHFTAGQQQVIVEWRSMRFLLLTCYDLRFPVWSRYGWAGKYDAIICVANWPQKRMDAWRVLTHARAIENQCYMIAVNRVGEDTACSYEGGSMVIDPIGRTMVACKENAEQSLVATVSIEEINKARKRFRVLSDGDYPMV